jgi:NAD(P)-dependent dehydrogenase (short-subunit alcohol dehydrogenase family)
MGTLRDQKIVIVGGSSGIGLGVAAAALERGAEVRIVGRTREKLQAAERTLAAKGAVAGHALDMSHEADVARMFDEIGGFDHLVVTAGTPPPNDPIDQADLDIVRRFLESKLVGSIVLAKHAARTLRTPGSMIFTSGINKDRPPVPGGSVVAAVAGSFGYFARALALELAPRRVNVVSPGWVDTPMWDDIVGDAKSDFHAAMAPRLPAGKIASPAEVAPAYVFLMESDFTTGETLRIDGGHNLI